MNPLFIKVFNPSQFGQIRAVKVYYTAVLLVCFFSKNVLQAQTGFADATSNAAIKTAAQNIDLTFDLTANPTDGNSMEGLITPPHSGMVTFKIYSRAGNCLYMENIEVQEGGKTSFKIPFKNQLGNGKYIVICILDGDLTRKNLMIVSR